MKKSRKNIKVLLLGVIMAFALIEQMGTGELVKRD